MEKFFNENEVLKYIFRFKDELFLIRQYYGHCLNINL